jgi:hypothetical protein
VVAFFVGQAVGADGEFAGHAQVDAEPEWGVGGVGGGEAEEHLLGGGLGGIEPRAGEVFREKGGVGGLENPGARVEAHGGDGLAEAGIPAAADVFDFGEFGHGWEEIPNPKLANPDV